MIKADFYYRENLHEIKTNGYVDESPRPKYADGTPAHSKFITQVFEKYDISKGEFPITTLRNTAIKGGINEILTIYQDQTNTKTGFHNNSVYWWDDWMNDNGDIGRAYSHNLESHRQNEAKKTVVRITPKLVDPKFFKLKPINKRPILDSIDGIIYKSDYRGYGEYIIVDEFRKKINNGTRLYVKCQFLDFGYITDMRKDMQKRGQHPMNNLSRTLLNIGYLDDYHSVNINKELVKILKTKWTLMLNRCYGTDSDKCYDEIFVHQEWHSFKQFLSDVRYLPQYHLAKEDNFIDWELDKDYYGSNCYSKDTCVFLHKKENTLYRKSQIKPIKITDMNGSVSYELSYTSLANTLGVSKGHIKRKVDNNSHKSLNFEFIEDDTYLYRYELSRNQINSLLHNLKHDPYSRRHIISFWNWSNIDKKELVECAYETLWSVRKEGTVYFLDLTLTQRSNDYIMAGYINKIQYVALQLMVASHLGYQAGVFSHLVQNLHIYDRHEEALTEILDRIPINKQPSIKLANKKDFYDITIDDFIIENIDGIEKLNSKLELAI